MPSLIDIRRRIRSVRSTQQITRAMKLVSAAKLRGAQERVIAARPYASLLRQVLGDVAAAGMVATLANNIPMFTLMKDMDERGKVINVAFAVSAAFVFGDHLGFTAGVERGLILAMIVGKLVGGITAVILACKVTPANAPAPAKKK